MALSAGLSLHLSNHDLHRIATKLFFAIWVPVPALEASGTPDWLIVETIDHADKVAHLLGACLIVMLYVGAIGQTNRKPLSWLQTTSVVFLLALASEVAQHYIGRNFSLTDILAGVAGSLLALILLSLFRARRRISSRPAKLNIVIRKQPESVG